MKNKIRFIFQLIILALIGYVAAKPLFIAGYTSDFEAYCPFGGISSLASKLNQGTMSCNMSEVQLLLGVGLLIGVIVIGKLFCSYLCPIGSVTEWIGKLGEKLKIRREIPKVLDRPLRLLKYVLLFITIYLTMTTSELFCKEYDPYFAAVNLFDNSDIYLLYAIIAFAITIIGTLVFRLFWCKYLCPLGALSNIFLNAAGAGIVIVLFIILNLLGAGLGYIYLLAGIVIVGIITELGFMRSFLLPLPKITRNVLTCTDCGHCDTHCPQGIHISEYEKVNHIDCNLCTDCVYACPHKNTLSVGGKKDLKFLAPIATVVLIILSLAASANFELTTISERWGKFDQIEDVAMYEQTGLKNVKCYGSAMSLKNSLENVEGIYGLDAYAKSHTVKIYYDSKEISEKKVKKAIFTPIKMEVKLLKGKKIDSLAIVIAPVMGLFDLIDFNNMFYALRELEGVYGFETEFGEPVRASIFYDPASVTPEKIRKQIELESISVEKVKGNGKEEIDLNFKIEGDLEKSGFITIPDYRTRIFRIYDRKFNNYVTYEEDKLSVFIFAMPEAGIAKFRRYFGQLTSHLSADDGIVRFSTRYNKEPMGYVFFDPSQTNVERIKEALVKEKLTIFLSDTETKDVENPFHIKAVGEVKPASDIDIDEDEE